MLISTGTLPADALVGQVAIVTGAGGGIGFEAARALCWLGARVVVAELDAEKGAAAAAALEEEFGYGAALFVATDVGDEEDVEALAGRVAEEMGRADILIHNATEAPLGGFLDVSLADWDASYETNLLGPVMLTRAFLPGMLSRGSGVVVFVTSMGTAYMGAYETMKAAQAHLSDTLAEELEGKGIQVFAIGPGFVPTASALSGITRLAPLMGVTLEELRESLATHTISVEAAGAGFAAAVANARKYHGEEISAAQALADAGIALAPVADEPASEPVADPPGDTLELARKVQLVFDEQTAGWRERSVFERSWLNRSFKGRADIPAEEMSKMLARLVADLEAGQLAEPDRYGKALAGLDRFYAFLYQAAKGYGKDAEQRRKQLEVIDDWREDVVELRERLA